jgi:FAD:protein FMN transferase
MLKYKLFKEDDYFKIAFFAMASPCEILLFTQDKSFAKKIANIAIAEIQRIESKYSRYQKDNHCWQLNHSFGKAISIDQETFDLLEYASQLFLLSDSMFDITSGVLRKIWQFSDGAIPPSQNEIVQLLPFIGFDKVTYSENDFFMPVGMELDFGGIGKEYCVDSVSNLIKMDCEKFSVSFLVNLGGDLFARNFNPAHPAWKVGLESVQHNNESQAVIEVSHGAIATSGSTKRAFKYQGKHYAHILNPVTGYPIEKAPLSVSVFARTCSLAGGMSSLAQLKGKNAEKFLIQNKVKYICCW